MHPYSNDITWSKHGLVYSFVQMVFAENVNDKHIGLCLWLCFSVKILYTGKHRMLGKSLVPTQHSLEILFGVY